MSDKTEHRLVIALAIVAGIAAAILMASVFGRVRLCDLLRWSVTLALP